MNELHVERAVYKNTNMERDKIRRNK